MLLFIALLVVYGFRFKYSAEIIQWRLARIAMVHANLMASEKFQENMGTVDPATLGELSSYGYGVAYGIYDPEKGEFVLNKIDPLFEDVFNWEQVFSTSAGLSKDSYKVPLKFGYVLKTDLVPWDYVTYSLPITYKDEGKLKYGLLFVALYPTMSSEQVQETIETTKFLSEKLEAMTSG
jgi:hypothetical protein